MDMTRWYARGVLLFCCFAVGLSVPVSAAAQEKDKKAAPPEGKKMLELRLSCSKNVVDYDELVDLSCELKNVSDKPITIVYLGSNGLRDYITYFARRPGCDWNEGQKANIHLSDLGIERLPQVLEPGKSLGYKEPPGRFFPSTENPRPKPGIYQYKAVFEYRDPDDEKAPLLRVESNVLEIELRPKNK
jgi:hypothetical protein